MIQYKTKKDLSILREAGKRHARILAALREYCVPGRTTAELNSEGARLIEEEGGSAAFFNYQPAGTPRPYPASVCVSVNEVIVHGIPTENVRTIRDGDLVSIDVGLLYKGRITDAAITVCVGTCPEEHSELNEATRKALEAGINAAGPKATVGDIGAAISEYARTTSFSLVKHLSGHGVGFSVHEDPFVPNVGRKGTGPALREGMVIAIEPMLTTGSGNIVAAKDGFTYSTKEGTPSSHWEHTVAITARGAEVLTR